MLFSERKKISDLAEQWCRDKGIPVNVFNVVTALDALGLLQQSDDVQTNGAYCRCGDVDYPDKMNRCITCGQFRRRKLGVIVL